MSGTSPRDYNLINLRNGLRIGIFKALPNDVQQGLRTTVQETQNGVDRGNSTQFIVFCLRPSPADTLGHIHIPSRSPKLENHWNPGYSFLYNKAT